jgi:hypothetical protein
MTSPGFSVSYSYTYWRYISHIYSPLPSPPTSTLPSSWPCFTFLSFIISVTVLCSLGFCLGILPENILYFNQSNSSVTLLYTFPHLVLFNSFQCVLFLHRCDVFQYYSLFVLFFPSSTSLL